MLTDDLAAVRRTPKPALLVLGCGVMIGALLGLVFVGTGGGGARVSTTVTVAQTTIAASGEPSQDKKPTGPATAGTNRPIEVTTPSRGRVQNELAAGVGVASALGGEASIGVKIDGVGDGSFSGAVDASHRMWSMSKVVVSIAALEAVHDRPDSVLSSAITAAIRRSDNCAIRRVILGLQQRVGGVRRGIDAFEQVLLRAGVTLLRLPATAPAEAACTGYLNAHRAGLTGNPLGVAAQFGTAEWTVRGAVKFAFALATNKYGTVGERLQQLMREPKLGSLEEPEPPRAPPLQWGAGEAFPSTWLPAWKGGWGGSQDLPAHFIAGQIVTLVVGGKQVAVAASFTPRAEPPNDNPGLTAAPRALVTMFKHAGAGIVEELAP
jgi:hypothetical protein